MGDENDSPQLIEHLFHAALRYIEQQDIDALKALLADYPSVVQVRVRTGGLIHAAVRSGKIDIVRIVLDGGSDPNMPEGYEVTDDDITKYDPGYVPLHYAAKENYDEIVSLLLERGADPSAADYRGGTPLHSARMPRIAEVLLTAGAYPNADCTEKHFNDTFSWYYVGTPLHVAARCGDVEMIRTLVAHGADVNRRDFITGHTALQFATETDNYKTVKALLDLGASPSRVGDEPYREWWHTPLHTAVWRGNIKIVKALLKAGADVNAKGGPDGKTAADLASERGHREIAAIFGRSCK